MGFYGNITNMSRSSFIFDRIYSNRYLMDLNAGSDDVFLGRYVLVNYETDSKDMYYKPWFMFGNNAGSLIMSTSRTNKGDGIFEANNDDIIGVKDVSDGDIVCILAGNHFYPDGSTNDSDEFWQAVVIGSTVTWMTVSSDSYGDTYNANFNIDKKNYGTQRGYDSTVWVKTYQQNRDTYVMVAELNTMVPIFDVGADAPTAVPRVPHYDPESTNIYYKLHVQSPWGFRIKPANPTLKTQRIDENGVIVGEKVPMRDISVDSKNYPSDEWFVIQSAFYDKQEDKKSIKYYDIEKQEWVDQEPSKRVPAAIYYNKAGFDPGKIHYSHDEDYPLSDKDNEISIAPSGISGNTYSDHNGFKTVANDTQELKIMLPSVGNTIAKVWDIIYGGVDVNKSSNRNMDIAWENGTSHIRRDGLRLVNDEDGLTYATDQVNTLAGSINTAHDLIGMIITPLTLLKGDDGEYLLDEDGNYMISSGTSDMSNYDENRIYFNEATRQFYRKHLAYDFTKLQNTSYIYAQVNDLSQDNYVPRLYYYKNGSNYSPCNDDVFDSSKSYYIRILSDNEQVRYTEQTLSDFNDPNTGNAVGKTPHYWYQDINDSGSSDLLKMDYISKLEYIPGRKYYNVVAQRVSLDEEYVPDTYWYKDGNDYLLDTSKTATKPNMGAYYFLDKSKVMPLGADCIYVPGHYYYYEPAFYTVPVNEDILDADGNVVQTISHERGEEIPNGGNYILSTSQHIQEQRPEYYLVAPWTMADQPRDYQKYKGGGYQYHLIKPSQQSGKENAYIEKESYDEIHLTAITYVPGYYYNKNQEGKYVIANEPELDATKIYYVYSKTYELVGGQFTIDDKQLNLIEYKPNLYYQVVDSETRKIIKYQKITSQAQIESMIHQYETGRLKFEDLKNLFTLDGAFSQDATFYKKNSFHYLIETGEAAGSYILDTNPEKTPGLAYYLLKYAIPVTAKFYESYKYYEDGVDGKVISKEYDPTKKYYLKDSFYVYSDKLKIYAQGAEWNEKVRIIPPTVELARRSEYYELQVMPHFARNLNTLNGMILKANQMLEPLDDVTRTENTVAGAMHKLQDTIAHFGRMNPESPTIVDNYGRLTSAEINTKQSSSLITKAAKGSSESTDMYQKRMAHGIKEDIYRQVNSIADMEKQWITANINGDVANPTITIHHNFQPVNNTTASTDFNNTSSGQTFTTISGIVDATGHTVGTNSTSYTLPNSYKTFNMNEGTVTAASTNAALSIVADTDWIKTSAKNGTLYIEHLSNQVDDEVAAPVDFNTSSTTTFTTRVSDVDETGHVLNQTSTTYTLPNNFKSLQADDGNKITADSIVATGSIGGGDEWLDTSIKDGKLVVNHLFNAITSTTNAVDFNDEDSDDSFEVVASVCDETGHEVATDTTTYTLPYSFSSIETENGTVEAGSIKDGLTLAGGNGWIETSVNDDGEIIITHTITEVEHEDVDNETPAFGATFTIIDNDFDTQGHLVGTGSHTVTIPDITLENEDEGNIVTNITYEDGTFIENKDNIGNLVLGVTSNEVVDNVTEETTLATAINTILTSIHEINYITVYSGEEPIVEKKTLEDILNSFNRRLRLIEIPSEKAVFEKEIEDFEEIISNEDSTEEEIEQATIEQEELRKKIIALDNEVEAIIAYDIPKNSEEEPDDDDSDLEDEDENPLETEGSDPENEEP